MTVLSDCQFPLAVWVAQPAKKNVGSGLTVGPDASGVLALTIKLILFAPLLVPLSSIVTVGQSLVNACSRFQ